MGPSHCSCYFYIVWRWLENARIQQNHSRNQKFLNFWSQSKTWLSEVSSFPQHNLLINDQLTFMTHLIERKLLYGCFLVECCFCTLLINRPKFGNVAFSPRLALDHQSLHRLWGKHSRLAYWTRINQHWALGKDISGNGILTVGKCKFTILQSWMVSWNSCTYKVYNKDSILSPECLVYWSRWLEILQ